MFNLKPGFAAAAMAALGAIAAPPAQAALVGALSPSNLNVPSSAAWLDTTLSGVALIYDANFYSATEGRLVMLASGNTLAGPGVPAAAPGQSYFGAGDALRDEMLVLRINNTNGALVSGTVSVKPSNDGLANDSWQFVGSVTAFGSADYAGAASNTFDARFNVNSYDLSDVVQGLVGPGGLHPNTPTVCSIPAQSYCGHGYVRINAANIAYLGATNGAGVNFGVDWVRGAGVVAAGAANSQLGPWDDTIAIGAYANDAVTSDIFMTVPVPGALALFGLGLLGLGPVARRRRPT
jgi:hypothetical protein